MDLNALKAAFQQPAKTSTPSGERWKKFYPFWKMEIGEQAVVRFLPDADQDNPMGFITENLTHKLEVNGQRRDVPCLTMYGETCPCCELAQKFYGENNEDMGRKYYKKREYLANVLVMDSPIDVENQDEVKLVALGPKIFKLIQSAFQSDDLESPPYFYKGGHDFRIKKSKQGDYADYSLSSFAPRSTDIDEEISDVLEPVNLSEWRTAKIERETMEALIEASLTGGSVPQTPAQSAPAQSAPAQESSAPVIDTAKADAPADSGDRANSILEQIRARAKSQG